MAAGRGRRRVGQVSGIRVDSGLAALVPDPDRADAFTLTLDGAPQSHVDLSEPTRLEFEYVRRLGHVLDHAAPPGEPLSVLHLGGGGLTLPRYVAATRPRSGQRVVECDGALVELVRRELPLARDCRPRIRVGDAREVLGTLRADAFDVVLVDVYAGARIPVSCTTVEFVTEVDRVLRPGGLLLANVADGAGCAFARSQVATLRAVFDQLLLVADAAVLRGRRYGNLVLVAGHRPLPVDELTRLAAGDAFPGRVMTGDKLARFASGAVPVTDATAQPAPTPPPAPFGLSG
ncbi:MAG: fused MFS/spermidine synthase [Actinocatenispora sp.]